MPIKPEKRDGKGVFQEPAAEVVPVDKNLIDSTIKEASGRIVFIDILHMIVVGFLKTLSGFLGIEEKSTEDHKGDS